MVPVAIHGSLAVRQWRKGRFPRITVSYGAPLTLERDPSPTRDEQVAAANTIFGRVRELYEALERG